MRNRTAYSTTRETISLQRYTLILTLHSCEEREETTMSLWLSALWSGKQLDILVTTKSPFQARHITKCVCAFPLSCFYTLIYYCIYWRNEFLWSSVLHIKQLLRSNNWWYQPSHKISTRLLFLVSVTLKRCFHILALFWVEWISLHFCVMHRTTPAWQATLDGVNPLTKYEPPFCFLSGYFKAFWSIHNSVLWIRKEFGIKN